MFPGWHRVAVTITIEVDFMLNWLIYSICFVAVLCTTTWRLAKSAVGMR